MARCNDDGCHRWRPDVLATRRHTGYWLDGAWYCSRGCLQDATRERLVDAPPRDDWSGRGPRIGDLLVSQQRVTSAALRHALHEQAVTRLPLGRQLESMGLVSSNDVLRALAAQERVGYLSTVETTRLHEVTQPLSSATLRELGLIPLDVDPVSEHLTVASRAPVPRSALRAIHEVTGWTAEPLLVSDQDWRTLAARTARQSHRRAIPVASVDEAVSATTAMVRERDTRDISVARVDPFILVRATGRRRQKDVLFQMVTPTQEAPCPAESTLR